MGKTNAFAFNAHICSTDHEGSVPKKISNLPESQAGPQRHRCAACAYEMGFKDGKAQALAQQITRKKHAHLSRHAKQ
jgi:hypothetical protein